MDQTIGKTTGMACLFLRNGVHGEGDVGKCEWQQVSEAMTAGLVLSELNLKLRWNSRC